DRARPARGPCRHPDAAGLPGPDGGTVQELRNPARGRRTVSAAREPHEREPDRGDDDHQRAAQGRQSGGVRARHVAELDRTLRDKRIARRQKMDLIADRGRRVTVDELNTTQLLRHARKQAVQRNLDDVLIVDVDAHHYENENYSEFLQYMENDVLKQ